ncbi:MAG: signal recognition particle-docking protein FtsY, partial [Candidatus Nitrotoga sp.]
MFGFLKKTPIESKSNPVEDTPKKSGWISRLKSGLARTADQMSDLFGRGGKIDDELYEELETIL